jgi:hypothetical protein
LSQRTRARTTGAEPKRAQKQRDTTDQQSTSSAAPEPAPITPSSLAPEGVARVLRAVAAELERDPALARRVAGAMRAPLSGGDPPLSEPATSDGAAADAPAQPIRRAGKAFKPKLVTGAAPALGPGVPDPFALREQLGEDGLRAALADLRLGTLRAIVREYRLDPTGQLAGQNDDAKFRALILRATKRGKRG